MGTLQLELGACPAYAVEIAGAERQVWGRGAPAFTVRVASEGQWNAFLNADPYSAAMAFIRGEIAIAGDLIAAIQFKAAASRRNLKHWLFSALARFDPRRMESWFQSKRRAADNIRFHYDRSNDFYRLFLDSRMQYSEGYFKDPSWSLEQAQAAKLDLICRKLALQPGERFLDIGCGWGGLLVHAAENYGVEADGCTLSREQFEYANAAAAGKGLQGCISIRDVDYRELNGSFHKIASTGMYEHVGRRRLRPYLANVFKLLDDTGLFLNSGITRSEFVTDDPETLLLHCQVFPGGELPHLSDVVGEAENAGFDVLNVEAMRFHYALTCREWASRLRRSESECLRLVDPQTYRTWLLYLSASALSFEEGLTNLYQVLMSKRSSRPARRLARD